MYSKGDIVSCDSWSTRPGTSGIVINIAHLGRQNWLSVLWSDGVLEGIDAEDVTAVTKTTGWKKVADREA